MGRIDWRRVATIGVTLLVVALTACGDSDDSDDGGGGDDLVVTDPGTVIAVSAGQDFTIQLESNPTTGYSWEIAEPYDEAVVTFLGEEYDAEDDDSVGSGGLEDLRFTAVAAGATTIVLEYVRPWEEGVEPAQELSFQVEVG